MKVLVPVDASAAALAPIRHIESLARAGVKVEVLLVNVQPRFSRHIAQFTSRAARRSLRAERSAAAFAQAIDALAAARAPFAAVCELGGPAERIAAVAERERVDEIMIGVGRHPAWLRFLNPSIARGVMARTDIPLTIFSSGRASALARYGVPAGLAGLATILYVSEL
jgi:nucleotide-binding universal stress UspA family protein